jgi:hypothetical protein
MKMKVIPQFDRCAGSNIKPDQDIEFALMKWNAFKKFICRQRG